MKFKEHYERSKWCLNVKSLELLLEYAIIQGNVKKSEFTRNCGDVVKVVSIPLRSSVSSSVYYEVIQTRCKDTSNVFINAWISTDRVKLHTCVYHNGKIIRWGLWVAELVTVLPSLLQELSQKVADSESQRAVEAIQNEEGIKRCEFSELEMELALNWNVEGITTSDVYVKSLIDDRED